jgi:hypothetical protein
MSKTKKAGIADISNPPIVGICLRKKARYGSVTVNTGLRIGNCLGSCGNQLSATLKIRMLEKREKPLETPWKRTAVAALSPGMTAAGIARVFSFRFKNWILLLRGSWTAEDDKHNAKR